MTQTAHEIDITKRIVSALKRQGVEVTKEEVESRLFIVEESYPSALIGKEELVKIVVEQILKEKSCGATEAGKKQAEITERRPENASNMITQQANSNDVVRRVFEWASILQGEATSPNWPLFVPYSWVKLAKRLYFGRGQIFKVVGEIGSGKTTLSIFLEKYLSQRGVKVERRRIRKGQEYLGTWIRYPTIERFEDAHTDKMREVLVFEKEWQYDVPDDTQTLLLDFWDYNKSFTRDITKALDGVQDFWIYRCNLFRRRGIPIPNIVILLQKECLPLHFFLGKAELFQLKPHQPEQLVNYYRNLFGSTKPFSEEALLEIAQFSKGNFRQFKRFIAEVIIEEDFQGNISLDAVRHILSSEKFLADLELGLSELFPKSKARRLQAIEVLKFLREHKGEATQKEITERIFSHNKMAASRLLSTMATAGILEIKRGHPNVVSLRCL